jgi:hypothetical protein
MDNLKIVLMSSINSFVEVDVFLLTLPPLLHRLASVQL